MTPQFTNLNAEIPPTALLLSQQLGKFSDKSCASVLLVLFTLSKTQKIPFLQAVSATSILFSAFSQRPAYYHKQTALCSQQYSTYALITESTDHNSLTLHYKRVTEMASTLPSSEMIAIAFAGQENNVPAAEERAQLQTHTFLSLAPTTSASYPLTKASPTKAVSVESKPAVTEEALALATPAVPVEKTRRSSSLSSDGSLMQKKRFLKLGPVHFGASDGDWSEEVVE
ncbi:hypothetical protein IFR04_004430 [Cadophora malorum]|uniref:Uncharacterized protein n=1 Tax=Cadophora malorum TaxID=108018 RepID=A0A8H8BS42_9HELO|nr:hypothetical protein IFR04_004430 [Cadophora malorum]